MKQPCVYLLASRRNGTLYVGVTSNLIASIWQHRTGETGRILGPIRCPNTGVFEQLETMEAAILREKQIKEWRRAWKIALIEKDNPQW
jgi:putative endonuclease